MTKYSILTLCFLFLSFATFAQDYEMETGSTSSENATIIPSEENETVYYKGISFRNPNDAVGNYQLAYTSTSIKISFVGNDMTSDYCDCRVERKEVAKANGYTFYETGICIGEQFESGELGMYIKNEKGITVIAYYNYGQVAETRLLALTEEDLSEAVTTNMDELQEMIALLAEWYKE
jgi:hypothetical protein